MSAPDGTRTSLPTGAPASIEENPAVSVPAYALLALAAAATTRVLAPPGAGLEATLRAVAEAATLVLAAAASGYAASWFLRWIADRRGTTPATGAGFLLRLAVPLGILAFGFPQEIAIVTGPLVASALAQRRSPHASDAAFFGVLGLVALAVAREPKTWEQGLRFAEPLLVVALALLAREAWDLRSLSQAATDSRQPIDAGPADLPPHPRAVTTSELLRASAATGVAGGIALAIGMSRTLLQPSLGETLASGGPALALAGFLVGFAGLLLLVLQTRKRRETAARVPGAEARPRLADSDWIRLQR